MFSSVCFNKFPASRLHHRTYHITILLTSLSHHSELNTSTAEFTRNTNVPYSKYLPNAKEIGFILEVIQDFTIDSFTSRQSIKEVLEIVKLNDKLLSDNGANPAKHLKLLKRIKFIMMACMAFNFIDDFIYQIVSQRTDPNIDYGIVNCPGE